MKSSVSVVALSFFALLLSSNAEQAPVTHESMQTRAFVEQGGELEGSARGDIYREPGRVRLVEVRTTAKGKTERLNVVFDPETLVPVSWTRDISNGTAVIRTELHIANGKIEARTYDGAKSPKVSTLAVPDAPWCVAPLIKFQAALCVASSGSLSLVRNVAVTEDGSLKVAEMKFEDLGPATVKVPAGEFRCRHLRLTPVSMFMSALIPPGDLFVGVDGTRPMVRTLLPPTRFSSTIVTELESYKVESNAPDAAHP